MRIDELIDNAFEGYDITTSPATNEGPLPLGQDVATITASHGPMDEETLESYLLKMSQEQENELSEILGEYSPEETGDIAGLLENLYKK